MGFKDYLTVNEETDISKITKLGDSISQGTKILKTEYSKQRRDEANEVERYEKEVLKKIKELEKLLK